MKLNMRLRARIESLMVSAGLFVVDTNISKVKADAVRITSDNLADLRHFLNHFDSSRCTVNFLELAKLSREDFISRRESQAGVSQLKNLMAQGVMEIIYKHPETILPFVNDPEMKECLDAFKCNVKVFFIRYPPSHQLFVIHLTF